METFDESLKFLLHEEPEDFFRFGFADPMVTVIRPCEVDLPSRDRDIDGSYEVIHEGVKKIAHIEFHRRHQSLEELAIDVAEAQIRLYRREREFVVSHVWDLYGSEHHPLLGEQVLTVGPGSQSTYVRVNLRALTWEELLARAPSVLWPLAPLTKDGATENAVKAARDAIVKGSAENSAHLADHLAILWFVAEAEGVPSRLVRSYIEKAQLMESELYKSIFAEGEERGRSQGLSQGLSEGISQGLSQGISQGAARTHAGVICKLLTRHLGPLEPSVHEKLASWPQPEMLEAWEDEAIALKDAKAARKLLQKILKTPSPNPTNGSPRAA